MFHDNLDHCRCSFSVPTIAETSLHSKGPLLANKNVQQYSKLKIGDFLLSLSCGNNYFVRYDGVAFLLKNIIKDQDKNLLVLYQQFLGTTDFFDYPLKSSELGILQASNKMSCILEMPASFISHKSICLKSPVSDQHIIFPMH